MVSIFNFLMIAGVIQGFIFIFATFSSRKRIERPILYLNLFVLFLSLNNLQSWLIDKNLFFKGSFWEDYTIPWYVLIVPMFYAFLIYYLEIEKKRLSFLTISISIFCTELLVRAIVVIYHNKGVIDDGEIDLYNSLEDIITFSYSLFLFFKATRLIYKYRALYAGILVFDDLKWIKRFMSLGMVVFCLWLLAIFWNLTGIIGKPYSFYPLRLSSSILIYWVGYQGFFRYKLLKDRVVLRKEIRKEHNHNLNTIPFRTLPPSKGIETFDQIKRYIEKEQRYLDPFFSLDKLSNELGLSVSSLSKIINTHATYNFSDFINNYRVEEVKRLLSSHEFSHYTMTSIGLECGFNSKSTFYAAFKKNTAKTPSEYQSSIL